MTKRFEAFKAEYDALCKKYGVSIRPWKDWEIALCDLDHDRGDAKCFLEMIDRTKETDDGKETE